MLLRDLSVSLFLATLNGMDAGGAAGLDVRKCGSKFLGGEGLGLEGQCREDAKILSVPWRLR